MTEVIFKDTGTKALVLSVISGELCLENFCVLDSGQIETEFGIGVTARIIGASHIISFTLPNGWQWHEIFACSEEDKVQNAMEGSGILTSLSARTAFKPFRGVTHDFHFSAASIEGNAKTAKRIDELRQLVQRGPGNNVGLYRKFPTPDHPEWEAATFVFVQAIDHRQLMIKSAHAYPQEGENGAIVFSDSYIRLPKHIPDL